MAVNEPSSKGTRNPAKQKHFTFFLKVSSYEEAVCELQRLA